LRFVTFRRPVEWLGNPVGVSILDEIEELRIAASGEAELIHALRTMLDGARSQQSSDSFLASEKENVGSRSVAVGATTRGDPGRHDGQVRAVSLGCSDWVREVCSVASRSSAEASFSLLRAGTR
jgi:hypothetical protein